MRQNTCIFATQTHTPIRPNFNLIQTYTPLFAICLRAFAFIAVTEQLYSLSWTQSSESHTKFASIVSLLYVFFDHYWFFENDFNFVVVFLYPILAMVMFKHLYNSNSTTPDCTSNTYIISTLLIDIVWSVLSNLYTVNMSMHFFQKSQVFIVFSLFLCCLHIFSTCFFGSTMEFFLRAFLFYACNFFVYQSPYLIDPNIKPDCRNGDSSKDDKLEKFNGAESIKESRLCFYVSIHILFVNFYVMLGSILALIAIAWNFCNFSSSDKRTTYHLPTTSPSASIPPLYQIQDPINTHNTAGISMHREHRELAAPPNTNIMITQRDTQQPLPPATVATPPENKENNSPEQATDDIMEIFRKAKMNSHI